MAVKPTDVTLTGTITDDQGNLLNGTITITLQGYGATVPTIGGSQVLAGLTITAAVTSGVFSTTFYSNQIITPGPLVTFYSVAFQQSATSVGQIFNFSQNYQFGAGSFDLSNLVPLTAVIANKPSATQVTSPTIFNPIAHQFLNGMSSTGNFSSAQPAPADLTTTAFNNPLLLGASDTGLSRDASGVVDIGNGTAGDKSGTLKAFSVQTGSDLRVQGSTNGGFVANTSTLGCSIGLTGIYGMTSGAAQNATDTGISRSSAANVSIGNGTQGNASGFLQLSGININNTSTTGIELNYSFNRAQVGSAGIWGFTSGAANVAAADTAISRTAAGTMAIGNGAQGDASGTLQLAKIQSSSGTATMGFTFKKGSGSGNYVSASTSYVQVDGTNLTFTVTIPTGWKLGIQASGSATTATGVATCSIALADGGSTIVEIATAPGVAGSFNSFSLTWVITGDGASHTVDLRYKTNNASDSATIGNSSATFTPSMVFTLVPSN